jgi:hypothetical protein
VVVEVTIQITIPANTGIFKIIFKDVKSRSQENPKPLLSARLIFDDHIRCMAAKQRLNRGRKRSRTFKLGLIAELLGMRLPQSLQLEAQSSPVSPLLGVRTRGSTPGSVQKLSATFSPSTETIPPDPDTGHCSTGANIHHI